MFEAESHNPQGNLEFDEHQELPPKLTDDELLERLLESHEGEVFVCPRCGSVQSESTGCIDCGSYYAVQLLTKSTFKDSSDKIRKKYEEEQ